MADDLDGDERDQRREGEAAGSGEELRSLRSPGGQPNILEMVDTDGGRVLTTRGRWQVVKGLARPVIKYEGDPDTRPITRHEVVWIVLGAASTS